MISRTWTMQIFKLVLPFLLVNFFPPNHLGDVQNSKWTWSFQKIIFSATHSVLIAWVDTTNL